MIINNFFLKLIWIFLILLTFALGFWNIALAVTDYYQYDKITNIERVTPNNVTFPAITICSYQMYRRDLYDNGSFINSSFTYVTNNKNLLLKKFINWKYTGFNSSDTVLNVSEYLEYFQIPDHLDCLRFNGAINKSVELFTANKTEDYFAIQFNNSYNESIGNRYFNNRIENKFRIFIADNYLNSFDKLEPYTLDFGKRYEIDITKETVETKLPEPYNQCKESTAAQPYHQSICIDTCLHREISEKYNCTFLYSLYSFVGFKQCDNLITNYKKEFSKLCLKECPLEGCNSEKFNQFINVFDRRSFTFFKFSFKDFSTLNITQIPKTDLFTFINNVGGGLGLFMGIAFPNVIELLQYVTEIVLIVFNN